MALFHRLGSISRALALVTLVAVAAFWVGGIFVHRTVDGVLVAGVLALAVIMIDRPVVVSILSLCAMFLGQRLGGSTATGTGGLAYSDAILTLASVIALPMVLQTEVVARLRLALIGLGVYLALLLPTLILHLSKGAGLEWMHRAVLVGGALIVGASIARADATTAALRILVAVGVVYAALAIAAGARHGFSLPAEPLSLNKNFIGALLGDVTALTLCAYRALGLRRRLWLACLAVLSGGLLATQSRGSMLAAAIAVYVAALLSGRATSRGRQVVAIVVAAGLTYGAYVSITREFHATADVLKFNSVGARLSVEHYTQQLWRTSPIDGLGLKYFRSGKYGALAQPPNNVIDNELAESGVVGAVGFLALEGLVIAAGVRRRKGEPFVVAATGLVIGSLFHGMIDIYWIAGSCALPYMILGMAVAGPPPDAEPDTPARRARARARSA